jgi:hypothetical protein
MRYSAFGAFLKVLQVCVKSDSIYLCVMHALFLNGIRDAILYNRMECMRIQCKGKGIRATQGFAYIRKGKGKYMLTCDACKAGTIELLNTKHIQFTTGLVCPMCCGTGTNKRFLHVQQGHCFRCNGKGHW